MPGNSGHRGHRISAWLPEPDIGFIRYSRSFFIYSSVDPLFGWLKAVDMLLLGASILDL